ncbi:hypothetical protein [Thalassobaculum sp.]|uniref:hypothetical protein n=1 Tax=Thalassobaculum sp. TaxID=2022740 RepID=UPI0032EB4837
MKPTGRPGRGIAKPRLIDRIVDYPYRRLFGVTGCTVIVLVILAITVARYAFGIATVTLDPRTCELAWKDAPYKLFHKEGILENTRRELGRLTAEKQKVLWDIQAGRDPFPSKGDGNVARIKRIDNDKFFWRAYAQNLEKDLAAMGECLHRLPTYRFD